jgi:hypothetical protein
MRRVPVLFAALTLAVTGCTFSDVDPDATIHVSGRALDASGEPLAGARVLLFKEADLGEVLLGSALVVGTLSTVCLLPAPPAICREGQVAEADDQGRYEFELKGADTHGSLGTEATLNIVFAGPGAQGSTTVSFTAKDTEVTLPDARLWRARPEVDRRPDRIGLSWSSLPRTAGSDATYSAQLFDSDAQSPIWSEPGSGGASIDPRILEDQAGAVAVGAEAALPGGIGAGDVRVSYLSARVPVEASAGAPPSRGRPCAAVTGTAARLADPPPTCPVTDGDLDAAAHLRAGHDGIVTGVVVDLGAPRSISLVVARGFGGQLLVEVSGDARTFRTVATGSGPAAAFDVPGRPSARFLRVRSPSGLDQSLASEVSVW